jgi:hypothetical protein
MYINIYEIKLLRSSARIAKFRSRSAHQQIVLLDQSPQYYCQCLCKAHTIATEGKASVVLRQVVFESLVLKSRFLSIHTTLQQTLDSQPCQRFQ